MRPSLLAVALSLFAAGCSRYDSLPDGAGLIRQSQRHSDGAVEIEQTNVVLERGRPRYSRSMVLRDGPDRVRAEIRAGDGIPRGVAPLVVTRDGASLTRFAPKLRLMQCSDLPQAAMSAAERLHLLLRNYTAVTTAEEHLEGHRAYLVELRPRREGRPLTRLWLKADSLCVLRQEEWGPDGRLLSLSQAVGSPQSVEPEFARAQFAVPGAAWFRTTPGDATHWMQADDFVRAVGFSAARVTYVPAGFRVAGPFVYTCQGSATPCARWEMTDGRVAVSVYQTRQPISRTPETGRLADARGPFVSLPTGNFTVMAQGNLSVAELERVARGMVVR